MEYSENLKPGRRENAFYVEADFVDDKVGVQSSKNDSFYIYVWDPIEKKEKRKSVTYKHLKDMNY